MGSIALLLLVLGFCGAALVSPFVGMLGYVWFDLVGPQWIVYGPLVGLPFSQMIGVATLVGWLLLERNRTQATNTLVVLILLYTLWVSFTTPFALAHWAAPIKWERTVKVLGSAALLGLMLRTPARLEGFFWAYVLSLGYLAARGAMRTIEVGGGGTLVTGLGTSFLSDRTTLAVALAASLPIQVFLARHATLLRRTASFKFVMWTLVVMSVIAVVGTESRGGFLALAVVAMIGIVQARAKFLGFIVVLLGSVVFFSLVSNAWLERMSTIQTYEQDASASGRLAAWSFGIDIFKQNPFMGGGFGVYELNVQTSGLTAFLDSHSYFFEILAEQGGVGIALFMAMLLTALLWTWRIRREARRLGDDAVWEQGFATALFGALAAFSVGGLVIGIGSYSPMYFLFAAAGGLHVHWRGRIQRVETKAPQTFEPPPDRRAASAFRSTGRRSPSGRSSKQQLRSH